jgi:DNA polymerase I-like protein with 3'-5' exonuclease and polymerase domains
MRRTAIDYETYYDKDCSVKKGLENYLNHPDFDAYMVSIYSDDNFAWVGHPKDAPWDRLKGHQVLAHNRGFDEAVHRKLVKDGIIPPHEFGEWHCTADLSAYRTHPRSLKDATKSVFNYDMDKGVRDDMKGRRYEDISHDEKIALANYALLDSKASLCLWNELESGWPDWERKLSRETTDMCWDGLPVDRQKMEESIETLKKKLDEAIDILPWTEEKAGALSPKEWAAWCRERGKTPPKSMAKDDPEVQAWMEDNPEEGKVLEATHTLRGANSLLKKFETMLARVRPDERLSFAMKYFGANITGRDSGDGGFNTQNMPREGLYGVDLRGCIRAPSGSKLLVADLSQIEARGAAWLAGENNLLDLARQGLDWYEVMARAFGLYKGQSPLKVHAPELRHKMKQMCLGCQFKMSAKKFALITGVEFEDAQSMVRMFRAKMPKLVKLWGHLERQMRVSGLEEDKSYEIELPSGRSLLYRDIGLQHGLSAVITRGGKLVRNKFWAGTLIENATQAFARDIFMDRVLALRAAGHRVILRIHDEVIIETDASDAKDAAEDVERIMSTSPEWCATMPLATEVQIMDRYTK